MSQVSFGLDTTGATRLEAYLHAHIPLVRSMQVRVDHWDADGLRLSAPLAANLNHEGTAFGGSLESLAVLAGWGLLWLLLEPQPGTHIVVAESHARFLRPVTGTLEAFCPLPDAAVRQTFLETLQRHGKARLDLQSRIVLHDQVCVTFAGRFAAHRAEPHAP